jgi:hypothetical protein
MTVTEHDVVPRLEFFSFVTLVAELRRAQRNYIKSKSPGLLIIVKELENKVDMLLQIYKV